MSEKQTIAIDADDTLVFFNKGINQYVREHHGIDVPLANHTTYNLQQVWGRNDQETYDLVHGFYQSPGYRVGLETHEESRYVLRLLANKYRLILVTARPFWHRSFTQSFLDREYPDLFSGNYHIADLPVNSTQPRTKVEVCRRENAKVLIDDAPHHILSCAEIGVRGLLMDQTWNQGVSHPLVTRVKDWHDIGHHLL